MVRHAAAGGETMLDGGLGFDNRDKAGEWGSAASISVGLAQWLTTRQGPEGWMDAAGLYIS